MSIEVTTTDTETGEVETMLLDDVAYVLTVNEDKGFYVSNVQRYANGTEVVTIRREVTE